MCTSDKQHPKISCESENAHEEHHTKPIKIDIKERPHAWSNPIPSLEDELQSCSVELHFTFERALTKQEAAESLTEYFKNNAVSPEHVLLKGVTGIKYAELQSRLGIYDRDPDGYGPR